MSEQVKQYIYNHWADCIKENREDKRTLIGLPYPYTVPAVGYFDEMYYWDTYFTNIGLLLSERHMQAKHNTDNMLYLVDRYGFMPNGNRTFYLSRSQPPFLSLMVRDVYDYFKDGAWLKSAFEILKKEYQFWMDQRSIPNGLNRYGGSVPKKDVDALYEGFTRRVGDIPSIKKEEVAKHCIVCCESGWDMNPRWDFEGFRYAPVDLNSLLFQFEENMAYFSEKLGNEEYDKWKERSDARKHLMFQYMEDAEQLLRDYQFENGKLSKVFSAASFFILFAGLGEERHAKALVDNLGRLETAHGIAACEKSSSETNYQWDYPNGWACLQYIVVKGLAKYGYQDDARRIAEKYIRLVDKIFEETGNIWEKYNVVNGTLEVTDEYGMPAMMGWSAGVYLAFSEFLENVGSEI